MTVTLSNFEIRVCNILLDVSEAGIDLIGHNGKRHTLDALIDVGLAKFGGAVDETKLFETQKAMGIFTKKAVIVLDLSVSPDDVLSWADAMELTLRRAKDLEAAGMLNEAGPPPEPAESNKAILTARDVAMGGTP